ncbi:winged helix-turn-helix transcriptional regulator [Rudaeicoccus suwonensis]|uniref:HxlR family transcriptional regulator n=1 Tax=Rudaeicoccus suwonensis TaxID=657409 RepID=A0A561DWY7_9MICO|nr:helix-turn-helix domain-containing protein [Rudaeicoccus suwonensis]TWE07874.1 HxlR family transcriptional regulator [Rudaeicoccus suwonensis]
MAGSARASEQQVTRLEAGGPNSIAVANGIIGDEWTLWIVRMGLNGITQYNEWLNAGPISSSVLNSRLNRLVETDIMQRVEYTSRPVRHDYVLTARGRSMWPVLLTMWDWERVWVHSPDAHLPLMQHTLCEQVFSPVLRCEACDEQVAARDLTATEGPSGGWDRSIPAAATRRRSHSGHRPDAVIDQTMAMIGNRWSVALLGSVFLGATRFGQFEQQMGAPPTIVAERLRTFCDIGVLDKTPSAQRSDWTDYRLTEKGRAFFPVVASVLEWGQRWFRAPEGPALRIVHRQCRRTFHPRLTCSVCQAGLRGHSVRTIPDPDDAAVRATIA